MKMTSKIAVLLLSATLAAPLSAGNDPLEKAIKARQGEMQLRSFNAGPLFGMAKGKMDYDAELASKLAGNLKTLLDLDMGRAWPQGSDNKAYPGKTTSLPKIWETYPEIAEYGKNYAKAVNELAAVAGDGLEALRSKIGDVGQGCKGCHDDFREEE